MRERRKNQTLLNYEMSGCLIETNSDRLTFLVPPTIFFAMTIFFVLSDLIQNSVQSLCTGTENVEQIHWASSQPVSAHVRNVWWDYRPPAECSCLSKEINALNGFSFYMCRNQSQSTWHLIVQSNISPSQIRFF